MPSLHIITLPLLITFSFPLAVLAFITTTFAVSILLLRLLLVYAELAVYLIPQYLAILLQLGPINDFTLVKSVASSRRNSNSPPSSPRRTRRSRRLSSVSIAATPPAGLRGSASAISLPIPQSNPLRDFEGVGGWRLSSADSDDEGEDWTRINSRLILPAESPTFRHHRRSLTGGTMPGLTNESSYSMDVGGSSSGAWSPNTKRLRTPTHGFTSANAGVGDGYFVNNGAGQGLQGAMVAHVGNGQGAVAGGGPFTIHTGSSASSKSSGLGGGLVMKGRNA